MAAASTHKVAVIGGDGIGPEVTAEAQTSVKLDPTEPSLESKITFHVGQRRIYRFEVALPDDLRLPEVTLPSPGIWSIEKQEPQKGVPSLPLGQGRSILKIQLQQGVLGDSAVILRGKLARRAGFSPPARRAKAHPTAADATSRENL